MSLAGTSGDTTGTVTQPDNGTQVEPAPQNATDWAIAILVELGIDPNTHPNSVKNLAAQINLEQGGNLVKGFNPLNSTQKEGASVGGGTQGNIQQYTNWLDGLSGNLSPILYNKADLPMYTALQNNDTIAQYAAAVGKGDWLGNPPGSAANVGYGQGIANRYQSMLSGGEGGFAAISSAMAAFISGGITYTVKNNTNQPAPGIGNTIAGYAGDAASASGITDVSGLIKAIGSGFGIGWKGIGSIALGIGILLIGLLFIFHKQVPKVGTAIAAAA